mmetsp:Transcript_15903/g.49438  ORF Transcript_15903/g.49438 Transcript_15903/m.49438 type:complete len:248 (-) Transcript_15903:258-1001(-)
MFLPTSTCACSSTATAVAWGPRSGSAWPRSWTGSATSTTASCWCTAPTRYPTPPPCSVSCYRASRSLLWSRARSCPSLCRARTPRPTSSTPSTAPPTRGFKRWPCASAGACCAGTARRRSTPALTLPLTLPRTATLPHWALTSTGTRSTCFATWAPTALASSSTRTWCAYRSCQARTHAWHMATCGRAACAGWCSRSLAWATCRTPSRRAGYHGSRSSAARGSRCTSPASARRVGFTPSSTARAPPP